MRPGLRKEYQEKKTNDNRIVTEMAEAWVADNVVVINEKIDRKTVNRLIRSIAKFDETFSTIAEKIPSLARHLSDAEDGLQKVVTGRANDTKASHMLQRLSYLYSTLSSFFAKDLKLLLSSPLFKAPKNQPDARLDALQPPTNFRYDPTAIRDSFRHALTPDSDQQKMLNKIYRKKSVPLLDTTAVANQLLTLSYSDLEGLTSMGKVPMVATGEPEAAAPAQQESVDRNQKKD